MADFIDGLRIAIKLLNEISSSRERENYEFAEALQADLIECGLLPKDRAWPTHKDKGGHLLGLDTSKTN